MSKRQKRNSVNVKTKIDIINALDSVNKQVELVKYYNLSPATISAIKIIN
ncbi:hypothetical protein ENBRE01_3074 [Enteropsectra breve]|nr:hypothetical protein ENBRE01_3074 [Enteropsectra breve]